MTVSGNMLTIRGEREEEEETKDGRQGFYTSERSYSSFSRSLPLPGPVDESNVKAEYHNGVLTVTLPKLQTGGPPMKQIPIT